MPLECIHCGHTADDLIEVNYDSYVCQDCLDSFYVRCEQCNEPVLRTNVIWNDNEAYCQSCYDDIFTTCDRCGEDFRNEDLVYVEGYGNVCEYCRERIEEDVINGYHHSQFHPNDTSNFFKLDTENTEQYFGIELEIGGDSNSRKQCAKAIVDLNRSFFECKNDSSVPGDGFEIVSKPATYQFHYNNYWDDVCRISRKNGFRSHNVRNCGLHIHVSRKFFHNDKTALVKLWSIFHNNEEWLTKFSRRNISDLRSWAKFKDKDEVRRMKQNGYEEDSGRYQAINDNPKYTIEFRLFRGTLKYNTFIAILQLTKWLCDYVNEHNQEDCDTLNLSRTEFPYSELMEYIGERDIPEYDLLTPSSN